MYRKLVEFMYIPEIGEVQVHIGNRMEFLDVTEMGWNFCM